MHRKIQHNVVNLSQFGAGAFMSDLIDQEISILIKGMIKDMADEYIHKQQALAIFDLLLEELILEMDVVHQCREQTALQEILNELIDAELTFTLRKQLLEMSNQVR